jgi:hypothetical protein
VSLGIISSSIKEFGYNVQLEVDLKSSLFILSSIQSGKILSGKLIYKFPEKASSLIISEPESTKFFVSLQYNIS